MPTRIDKHGNLHIDPPKGCVQCASLQSQLTEALKPKVCLWEKVYKCGSFYGDYRQGCCGKKIYVATEEQIPLPKALGYIYCPRCSGGIEVVG